MGVWLSLRRKRWLFALVSLLGCLGLAYPFCARALAAKAFLGALSGSPQQLASGEPRVEELQIAGIGGPIRARLYLPSGQGRHRAIVVAHGVHYQGIDERRLVPFARALAKSGLVVLTPELVDLADYRLTTASIARITAAVSYLAQRQDLVEGERVALLGFSFAGGLGLVAASRPELAGKLEYVVSVGGHHDLDRVFRFLLTNEVVTPTGVVKFKAHDYGLAVVLYAYLEEFLAEPELTATRAAMRAWLQEDKATARTKASSLTGEGARLFQLLEQQKLAELSPQLKAVVEKHRAELRELSPRGRLKEIRVPVYLLHGAHDAVIPASEADFAGLELDGSPHELLVTPLIEHVEVNRETTLRERITLVAFLSHLF